jgi:hypothetical protein
LTSLENHEANVDISNSKMTYGQDQIQWRRSRVLELDCQGFTQYEISQKLQVGRVTVGNDLRYLKKQAQNNLQKHIHEVVPEEYQKGLTGLRQNLKHVLEIAESATDPKVKLEARRIANDCYRYIMDLCTNAGIINDALKFVTRQQEQIKTLQKIDERLGQTQEMIEENDQTTHNGVF